MSTEPQPVSNITLKYANALVAAGYAVFPCRQLSKIPATANGFKDASTDPTLVSAWFNNNRGFNLAVRCGASRDTNLLAIDVDPLKGGDETWKRLCDGHVLPVGPVHTTRSGGHHLFFDMPEDLHNTKDHLGPGVDTRGVGGYVVAPPSKVADVDTGEIGHYTWSRDTALVSVPVPIVPAWLMRLLLPDIEESVARHPSRPRAAGGDHSDGPFDRVRVGWDWFVELPRDGWTLVRQDGGDSYWARPGKDPREGHSAVLHASGAFVIYTEDRPVGGGALSAGPGVTMSPGEYVLAYRFGGDKSALARAYPAAQVRGRAVPDLDLGAAGVAPDGDATPLYLPDEFWSSTILLSEVRDQALARLRCPDAVLAALLTMYATTIPANVWLPGTVGAQAPLNLYAVVVGRSGGGKTSAMTIAAKLMGSPGNSDILLRKQLRSGEGLITLVNKPGKKGKGGEEDVPPSTNVGVHVHYDEGGALSRQTNQSAATIIPYLNTAWSGAGTVGGALRDGESSFDAARVRICALIGVQYGIGANLFMGEAATLGFPQRLLFLSADDHPAIQDQQMPDEIIEPEPLGLPFLRHSDFVKPMFVEIPRPIRQEVWDWSKQIPDPLDAHLMNMRLRIATVLMLMHGAGDSAFDPWWDLSGVVMTTHRDVRHAFVASIRAIDEQRDASLGISLGRRQMAQREYELDRGVESLLTKLGGRSLPTRALKDHFRSWKGRYGFDHRDILDRALLLGLVVEDGAGWRQI